MPGLTMALAASILVATSAVEGSERPPSAAADPCALLTDREIHDVQGREVAERLASTRPNAAFEVVQCVFRTRDLVSSVSLALGLPLDHRAGGARRFWSDRFHPEGGIADSKIAPPEPLPELGEEAFWVGDARTGSLYVLAGERFLRVSVGGAPDATRRRERAIQLAERALARLAATAEAPSR